METWITSDTHFGHENILKYQHNRSHFSSIEEHDETLIANWNSLVKPNDNVWFLGDFAFNARDRTALDILGRLNGKLNFIIGNHDWNLVNKQTFTVQLNWLGYYHELKGFTQKGKGIVLSHFPFFSWNKMQFGAMHFFGHTHCQIPFLYHGLGMDIGVDGNNLYPYNLPELVENINKTVDSLGEDMAFFDSRGRNGKTSNSI